MMVYLEVAQEAATGRVRWIEYLISCDSIWRAFGARRHTERLGVGSTIGVGTRRTTHCLLLTSLSDEGKCLSQLRGCAYLGDSTSCAIWESMPLGLRVETQSYLKYYRL